MITAVAFSCLRKRKKKQPTPQTDFTPPPLSSTERTRQQTDARRTDNLMDYRQKFEEKYYEPQRNRKEQEKDSKERIEEKKEEIKVLDEESSHAINPLFLPSLHTLNPLFLPSMPAPYSSSDDGEVWRWGDCVCLFEKSPIMVCNALEDRGFFPPNSCDSGMKYHYALVILSNRFSMSPYLQAILAIGIEQVIGPNFQGGLFLGVFHPEGHDNLGVFREEVSYNACRQKFIEVTRSYLKLSLNPEYVGTIAEVYPDVYKASEPIPL